MVDSPSFMSLDNGDGSIPQRVMNWIVDVLEQHEGNEMLVMMAVINALCYYVETDEEEVEFIENAKRFIIEQTLIYNSTPYRVQ